MCVRNTPLIARLMGPTWGPPGSCRPQVGPMQASWTLLSGTFKIMTTPPRVNDFRPGRLYLLNVCSGFIWLIANIQPLVFDCSVQWWAPMVGNDHQSSPLVLVNNCQSWSSQWSYSDLDYLSLMDAILYREIRIPINTLRPRQNGRLFADDTFKRIFLNENIRISFKISLRFVPNGLINNIPSLVLIMAWRRPGDKPLSEPMMVWLPTHICVTRPQWVNVF